MILCLPRRLDRTLKTSLVTRIASQDVALWQCPDSRCVVNLPEFAQRVQAGADHYREIMSGTVICCRMSCVRLFVGRRARTAPPAPITSKSAPS